MCTDAEIETGFTVSSNFGISFQFYESQMPFIDKEYFTPNSVLAVKGSNYFRIYTYTLSAKISLLPKPSAKRSYCCLV